MINLQRTSLQNAIAKAKTIRPRVRRTGERTYTVSGSKGNAYTVRFLVNAQGVKLGECNCAAGLRGFACYHLVSAAVLNIALHSTYSRPSESPRIPAVSASVERETAILLKRQPVAVKAGCYDV
jgi:hypothetical protein